MRLKKIPSTLHLLATALACLIALSDESARAIGAGNPAQQTDRLRIYWSQGISTAPALKQAGITEIAVPPPKVREWRQAGFDVVAQSQQDLDRRERLAIPRAVGRADVASATRRPWIALNGWRFVRKPAGRFLYDLTAGGAGQAALAIAEAFAYQANAILKIDPADLAAAGRMLEFLRATPHANQPPVADFGLIDDGSAATGECMNLLIRRNLLFRILPAPSQEFRVNLKLGSKEYPRSEASDPNGLALKIRRQIGDENRSLRIYGTEVVIGRLTNEATYSQLHLLNYSGREVEGMRVRIRGRYTENQLKVYGLERTELEDLVVADDATEFTIQKLGVYALIESSLAK